MPRKKKADQEAGSTGGPATGDLLFHHVVHQVELIERAQRGKDTAALDEAVAKLGTVMQRTRLSARPSSSRRRAHSPRKREPSEDVLWQGIRASCEDYLSDVQQRAEQASRDKHVADLTRLVRPQRSPTRTKRRSPPRAASPTVRPPKRLASRDATRAPSATKPKARSTDAQGGRKKNVHPPQTQQR